MSRSRAPPILADEVGHKDLDRGTGRGPHRLDRAAEMLRAAVGQVVAGHARDHDVREPQPPGRLGHPLGLVGLQFFRLALGHRAEAARPGAHVAENHERGRALRPALQTVGALGRRADCFQVQLRDQVGRLGMAAAGREVLP